MTSRDHSSPDARPDPSVVREMTDQARRAVDALRDFARECGMHFRQRDPLVSNIHLALDAFDKAAAPAGAPQQEVSMADPYPSTAQHTPGPWKFDNVSGCKAIKGGKWARHKQAQYRELANTSGIGTTRDVPDADAEDRANATLMAYAPQLWIMTRRLAGYSCAEPQETPCEQLAPEDMCSPCEARYLLAEIERRAKQKSSGA